MIKYENHLGVVQICDKFLEALVANVAKSCFGVAGLENKSKFVDILDCVTLKKNNATKGVSVHCDNACLIVNLHILVSYGVNISAIVQSIISKVSYTVQNVTGMSVSKVNVFVDGIK